MKEFLILMVLIAAAYFFRNYQVFGDQNLRPWAVQLNYDREGDPKALCDQLAPDAKVVIHDTFPRHKINFSGGKIQACEYFAETAKNFAKPFKEKNGYIRDNLRSFTVSNIDYLRGTADVQFTWDSVPPYFALKMNKGDVLFSGSSTTKVKLENRPFKDTQIMYYEFNRKLEAVSPE